MNVKRATIYDVAQKSGVSVGTVNRVMHNKPRVSDATRQKVMDAAGQLGYRKNNVAHSLTRGSMAFGVAYVTSPYQYQAEIFEGMQSAFSQLDDYKLAGHFICCDKPGEVDFELAFGSLNALVLMPGLPPAALEAIEKWRLPYAAADTLPHCKLFPRFSVRPNGRVAGRLAAELLSHFQDCRFAALFTGNTREVQVHMETADGFISEAAAQNMGVTATYENNDDPLRAAGAVDDLVKNHPETKGIYISSSNSDSVCRRLRERGLSKKIHVVATDLYPELAGYIMDGTVAATIFQNPRLQGKLLVELLYRHMTGDEMVEKDILVPPHIVMRGNLELYLRPNLEIARNPSPF